MLRSAVYQLEGNGANESGVAVPCSEDEQPTTIMSIEYFQGVWETVEVPPGYEIIGLYGCASEEFLTSLGFIVWVPNPFAV